MVANLAISVPEPISEERERTGRAPDRQLHRRRVRVVAGSDHPGQGALGAMAAALRDPSLHGVVAGEGLEGEELAELLLGLSKPRSVRRPLHPLLRRGVAVHSFEVDDYQSKALVVERVAGLAAELGLRRRGCQAVEQAVDELLLNALYDAPVDEGGRPRYAHYGLAERLALRAGPKERPVVRCGGDEERFVVAVRDPFGALSRETVARYLQRCAEAQAHRTSPLLRRPEGAGAGVGLYLVASCTSEMLFRLRRGCLTEVVCGVSMLPGPPQLRAIVIDDQG